MLCWWSSFVLLCLFSCPDFPLTASKGVALQEATAEEELGDGDNEAAHAAGQGDVRCAVWVRLAALWEWRVRCGMTLCGWPTQLLPTNVDTVNQFSVHATSYPIFGCSFDGFNLVLDPHWKGCKQPALHSCFEAHRFIGLHTYLHTYVLYDCTYVCICTLLTNF